MANLKADFIAALIADLPKAVADFLDKQIPTLQEIAWPTTEEAANIATGQLSYNLNLILKQFEGLTPLPVLLRAGQHNPVFQGILLSMLEYVAGSQQAKISFIAPAPGGVYYGWFGEWKVKVSGDEKPEKVTVQCNGEEFSLTPGSEQGVYEASWPVPIGEWQAYAKAYLKTNTPEALTGFSVRHWSDMPTIPEDGGSYQEISSAIAETGLSTENLATVEVSIAEKTYTLTKQAAQFAFDGVESLAKGAYTGTISFATKAGQAGQKFIHFVITAPFEE